ncbi:RHS repeat-associated core domain-containing protein [Streptomyces sp. NPDC102340]|uniref:RHS repeat-associated core domain-containing protein n=1 Tax=unclassified Streptomyces TaxID=2593676 RepID=UPI003815F8F4
MLATLALGAGALPALAAPEPPGPSQSAWGKSEPKAKVPPVKVGSTRPAKPVTEADLSAERRAWRAAQKKRATEPAPTTAEAKAAAAAAEDYVPEGQGDVPWHEISDFRIADSLVARVNYSTGNLMLAATDFEVAGLGRPLRLARTYNSLDAPWGKVSQRWWQEYERYAQIGAGQVVVYDATGDSLAFTQNTDGTYKTPTGYSKDLKKNTDGSYTLSDRKSGVKDTYNASGTLTKVSDRNGNTVTVTQHDETAEHRGFKLTETRTGRSIDLVKTDASQWQAKDHTGRTAVFDLNPSGDLAKTTDTEGKSTVFDYDSSHRLTKITTPEGRVTAFTYDGQNRVTSMLRATDFNGSTPTGPTYRYDYSASDPNAAGTTTVTDPEEHTTTYTHDGQGKVSKVTDPLDHSRSRSYDANNNIKTATDAMGAGSTPGNVTAYGWDARNNPTSAKLPTGATSTMSGYQTIAGADLPGSMTTPDGEKTDYTYDTAGNTATVAVTGTGGGTTTFTHNKATPTCGGFEGQRCTVKDARNKVTSFHYDGQGNLDKVTPPAPLGATTYTYDSLGRPETALDGRGIETVYTYDHRDRITEVSTTNTTVRYTYDGDGNLKTRTDDIGTIKYDFDPLSRETVRTLQDGSQTVLAYTPAGNVDTYTDPGGTIDYTWDAANNLKSLKDPAGRVTSYDYNNNDVRTKTTYPGGTVQTVTPDNSGRPKTIKTTSPKGTLVSLAYTYSYVSGSTTKDGAKIRTSTDAVAGMKTTYSYDSAGRFSYAKEEKGSTLNSSWQYCYDPAGNLTSQGVEQGCPRGTTYTYNDASQLTSKNGSTADWDYDKAGNELAGAATPEGTRTAEKWSDFSQLTSLTVGGTTYPADYGSTDSSERHRLGNTYYHPGPIGLAAETTAGVDTGFVREPQGTLNSMTRNGKAYYYLTDALGSVVALADETGTKVNTYAYSPRGVTRSTTNEQITQPYQFAGGHQDPTGLYHLGARYYDPNIGRFTQPDPSGQEKNPYLYAEGDPVNRIDPTGLLDWKSFTVGVVTTAAIGAAAVTVGAACGATAGLACAAAGAVTAGLWGGAAAGGTAAALGVDPESAVMSGVGGGLLSPFIPAFR